LSESLRNGQPPLPLYGRSGQPQWDHEIRSARPLVEKFVREFEAAGKSQDITRWSQFADMKDVKEEMLKRLDVAFEQWLNP